MHQIQYNFVRCSRGSFRGWTNIVFEGGRIFRSICDFNQFMIERDSGVYSLLRQTPWIDSHSVEFSSEYKRYDVGQLICLAETLASTEDFEYNLILVDRGVHYVFIFFFDKIEHALMFKMRQ